MQPNYGPSDINTHQFDPIEDFCSSLVFPFSNLHQNLNHSIPFTHQSFHHPHLQHFRPPFRLRDHTLQQPPYPPVFPVKFNLRLDPNCGEIETSTNLPQPPLPMPPSHSPQDSTSIKDPFWRRRNGWHEYKEQHFEGNKTKNYNFEENNERCKDLGNKHRLFGELEAIYGPAKDCGIDQTGSGSALTCENSPRNANPLIPFQVSDGLVTATINNGSDNSNGEEAASLKKTQKRTKKRKLKENLSSMVDFIENLVKQVMDHQEMLHKKFLQVIERMEKEREEREEERRREEAEKHKREAISRAHEQSLASSREAEIISYLEKITGQSINLPVRKETQLPNKESSRWPKAEVEALIQARSS